MDNHNLANDSVDSKELTNFIDKIERYEEDKASIAKDISDVYSEAKLRGYDVSILKKIVRLRKLDEQKRQEEEILLELYQRALGMISDDDNN